MNKLKPFKTIVFVTLAFFSLAFAGRAAVFGPYTVDANTLHLWHFDETGGIAYITNNGTSSGQFNSISNTVFNDAVTNNPQTTPIAFTNTPGQGSQPVAGAAFPPLYFAQGGQAAWTNAGSLINFGYAEATTNFSCALPSFTWPNPLSAATAYTCPSNMFNFINTNTGAFTFEAMVCPLVNPLTAGRNMEIFAGDSGFPFRAWQFRINTAGKLEFNININAPGTWIHDVAVPLPSTGPDAVSAGNWYHVAVTCTGNAPTNGDTPAQLKLYWTLMDVTRTNADVLLTTNITFGTFTNIALAVPSIGGSGRGSPISNVGNSEGFIGFIDEVRVSSVCRKSIEMAFNTNVYVAPPVLSIASSQTNQLVGYGQTLQITATESGTLPITNQWYENGLILPGQTNAVLIVSNLTFAANGNYQLLATNAAGNASSVICSISVGAAFNGAFSTGVDANGNPTPANGAADLHYTLVQSANTANLGPNAIDLGSGAQPTGAASGGDSVSEWLGTVAAGIGNGNLGTYSYRTLFQIDNGDAGSAVLSGNILACGPHGGDTVQAFLNGVETDIVLAPNPISTVASFVITNGLQAGSNVLVFTMNGNGGNAPEGCFRIHLSGIGNALPPGLPSFTSQPVNQTVTYGATIVVPEVALGRPPLSYQWLSNGVPISAATISSATNENLTFIATNVNPSQVVGGSFTANYQVVVSNDTGAVTSSVAAVTIQIPPPTVVTAGEPIWVASGSMTNVVVIFSQSMDPNTATNAGNYALDNGASVVSASLVGVNEVVLATSVLNPATTYTLTVQNVASSIFDIPITPSPTNLTLGTYPANVALWVRADTGVTTNSDGTVSEWNDLSTNANNLMGGTVEPVLATDPINGRPVIRFAATNATYMFASSTPSLAITNDLSILAVVNYGTLAGDTNGMIVSKVNGNNQPAAYDYYTKPAGVILLRGNGTGNASVTSTNIPTTGVQHILDVVMQGTNVTHRLDGLLSGTGSLSTAMADQGHPLSIGTREDGFSRLTGDLAELMVIGSALTTYDVAATESYFAREYNLQVGSTVNANPTNIVVSATGGQITLSWPQDHTGWQLQSNSVGLVATNSWFNVAGTTATNKIIIAPDSTKTNVFYRLFFQH